MKNYNFIEAFISLSKDERISFHKHVITQISESSDAFAVYKAISDYSVDSKINQEEIIEYIENNNSNLSRKAILNHFSNLYGIWQDWAVLNQVQKDKFEYDTLLLKFLNKKGLFTLADHIHTQSEKKLNLEEHLSLNKSKALSQMLDAQYFSYNPIKSDKERDILGDLVNQYLAASHEQLSLLKAELINMSKINNINYIDKIDVIDAICAHLPETELSLMFHQIHQLFMSKDQNAFFYLSAQILKGRFIDKSDLQIIFIKYTIKGANFISDPDKKLRAEIGKLYHFGMEHDAFGEHGKINSISFRNLVSNLCVIQTFSYVENFINSWQQKLAVKNIKATVNLSMALNCMYHEKYNDMHRYLVFKDYNDFSEKNNANILYLIYAFVNRKEDYNHYNYTFHNFKAFVLRNKDKISVQIYKGQCNLLEFLKNLDHALLKNQPIKMKKYEFLSYRSICEKLLKKYGQINSGHIE